MDLTQFFNQDLLTFLFLAVDFVLSVIALKKKSGKSITTTDIVQSDLDDLIKYHESTLAKLKSFKK